MPKLADIAHDMEIEARRRGVARRTLARGLSLKLTHMAGTKTLTLTRPVTLPGEDEISICRALFFVDTDAQVQPRADGITLRWTV